MGELRLPKRILTAEANGQRGRGRLRRRFLDSVKNDLNMRGLELNEDTRNLALN